MTANLPSFIGGVALRPNLVGNPILPKNERTIDRYFNTEAIRLPSVNQPFGNAGRNIGRGDSFYQFDFGLQKSSRCLSSTKPRGWNSARSFFNLLNKTNFNAPNGSANGIVFDANGRLTSGGVFGQVRSTAPARQIQFALKLSF
ncbi:MAG: hypothetical protein U0X75_27130 [Acidobacteriota bacterium]